MFKNNDIFLKKTCYYNVNYGWIFKQTCFPKSNLKSIFIMNSICNQIMFFNSVLNSNWILNSVSLTEFSNIFDLIFDFTIEFGEAHRIAKQIRFDLRIGHRIRWASPNSSNKSTDKVAQLNRLWLNRLPTLYLCHVSMDHE